MTTRTVQVTPKILWDDGVVFVFSFPDASGSAVTCGFMHVVLSSQVTTGQQTQISNFLQAINQNSSQVATDPATWIETIKNAARNPSPSNTIHIVYDDGTSITYTTATNQSFTLALLFDVGGRSAPSVTAVSPTNGAAGDTVTITGSGFTGVTGVGFGIAAATNFTFVSDTQVTAVSPSGAGTVDVTVVIAASTSATSAADQFTYNPPPVVTGISPTNGAVGDTVTITGSGFTGVTGVGFGIAAATNVTFLSDTQVTAVSPSGAGTVDVTVVTAAGTSATSAADQFTYNPAPVVTAISPTNGAAAGGDTVTITGSGFTGVTGVAFGIPAAPNVTFVSDTQVTAVSPSGAGTVDVTVVTAAGTSATSAADQFTYN
jgi:IPT/TIG domain